MYNTIVHTQLFLSFSFICIILYIFFILFSRKVLNALSRAFYIRKNRDFIFSILAVSCFRNLQLKVNKIKIKIRFKMVIQMQYVIVIVWVRVQYEMYFSSSEIFP